MDKTDEKLMLCPFCGNAPTTTVSCAPEGEGLISIGCSQDATVCPVSPHVFASTRSGAIAAWNRRPAPAEDRGEVVAVPREPTEAMIDRSCAAWVNLYPGFPGEKPRPTAGDVVVAVYRAMLDAAPPIATPQSRNDLIEGALREMMDEMGKSAVDPMWADHVELPKVRLRAWIKVVRAAIRSLASAPSSPPKVEVMDEATRKTLLETVEGLEMSATAEQFVFDGLQPMVARFHAGDRSPQVMRSLRVYNDARHNRDWSRKQATAIRAALALPNKEAGK